MRADGGSGPGDDALDAPHDTIMEHALLVARGVRPMALVDVLHVLNDSDAKKVHQELSRYACDAGRKVLPFTVMADEPVPNGSLVKLRLTYCGFAAERWVIGLLRFALMEGGGYRHQIIGLLLGYSAAAIQEHEDFGAGYHTVGGE